MNLATSYPTSATSYLFKKRKQKMSHSSKVKPEIKVLNARGGLAINGK